LHKIKEEIDKENFGEKNLFGKYACGCMVNNLIQGLCPRHFSRYFTDE